MLALPVVLAATTTATPARAQGDPAAAEALFEQARDLMKSGRYGEACPKLEESQRLDPGMGTQFNLANCYEHTGRDASAWALYREVAAEAKAAGQTAREKAARDRADALEPTLSKLLVLVKEPIAGLAVKRDGLDVGRGQWGTQVPVDPGPHKITATAPGRQPWETFVNVAGRANVVTVTVPALEQAAAPVVVNNAPAPARAPSAEVVQQPPALHTEVVGAEQPPSGAGQRIFGGVLIGLGLVGAGTGAVFAVESKNKHDQSQSHCVGNTCDPAGLGLRNDAIRDGNLATLAFGLGAAGMLGGLILWLTAPSSADTTTTTTTTTARVQASPMVGPGVSGFSLRGAF